MAAENKTTGARPVNDSTNAAPPSGGKYSACFPRRKTLKAKTALHFGICGVVRALRNGVCCTKESRALGRSQRAHFADFRNVSATRVLQCEVTSHDRRHRPAHLSWHRRAFCCLGYRPLQRADSQP